MVVVVVVVVCVCVYQINREKRIGHFGPNYSPRLCPFFYEVARLNFLFALLTMVS